MLRRAYDWHRPLMSVVVLMAVCAVTSIVGLMVDSREILGAPAWAKPLKFSLSILLYSLTWAWFIARLPRWRRPAHILGTVIAVTLVIEQVLITWAAASGTTSHFNVSSALHTAVWATMAAAITTMYLCTLVTSAAVFFLRLPTASATFAVRAGIVVALAGIGVAFLMTSPTAAQLSDPAGIIGAHAVGVADGGPGLPLLGWSIQGGDYRVAHFIGMHALQVLPLLALGLDAAGRRARPLAPPQVQLRLVIAASAAYSAALVLLTLQAAAGESVVRPTGPFLAGGWGIVIAFVITAGIVLARQSAAPSDLPGQAPPSVLSARVES
ncbi:hypothetical protein [Arthrobacter sp. B1805]|uniref:hypothetical protein n=1 Tax=Arthrobacter sp. B1805 TaxID=2058892 RepID=UPI0015E423D4|nr:hypothetical protein [Arthrobacter sp. B1805]